MRYAGSNAHYTFHLPLRMVETFVPAWIIAQLQSAPRSSRENGEYFGRAITETESFQQPIADILHELGVDLAAACPRLLSDKQEYMLTQAARFAAWGDEEDFDEDEAELDEEFWQNLDTRPVSSQRQAGQAGVSRAPDACPLCQAQVSAHHLMACLEHWQSEHPAQDLTIGQATWVLNCFLPRKEFYQQYPPDYRAPHEKGFGTRYWRVETLMKWLEATSG